MNGSPGERTARETRGRIGLWRVNLCGVIPFLRSLTVVLGLWLGLAGLSAAERPWVCFQKGDDPRWAAPDWDDRGWRPGNLVPSRDGVYWVRFRVELPIRKIGDTEAGMIGGRPYELVGPVNALFIAFPASFELFWDGRLLERSGVVGVSRETEVPGLLDHVIPLPADGLGSGEHVLAIRMSSFHYNFPATAMSVSYGALNYGQHLVWETRRPYFSLVAIGGALFVGAISVLFYALGDRWRPLLLCGVLSFTLAAFYYLIAHRWLQNDPYPWFAPRLKAVAGLMTVMAVLLPWLLVEQFRAPLRRWWFLALAPLLMAAWTISPLYEFTVLWLCRAMLAVSLGIVGWAAWRGRRGAWWLCVCMAGGLVFVDTNRRDFLDPSFFVIFGVLVLSVFATLAFHAQAERLRAREAVLTAARLETELLRKNLQPHFLLNTLTALTEVVERSPRIAVKLIDDLAVEFRSLAWMSGEKRVPLARELELCHAHLRVLSVRTGATCELEFGGADEDIEVPPALFLTLIENGFTHQRPGPGPARFLLDVETTATARVFVFFSPGEIQERPSRAEGGTGLRYVRARLEESYPGRWTFAQQAVEGGWRTTITITRAEDPHAPDHR